ncbi:hypothetical protein [Vibrio mangrovi]|uniref:Phage tail fiber repeat protein n=1 Tax=Vibrio mangrovi TaxID=474394 RepID=A0A1Y6ITK5_9VIBR|nr:hypothetical protein [Vibrio mangrovi]MDW6004716.1 hypothetical protein [Vibrio mangrovi]SMS01007.1 hypothetical protein VIM7927_02284 [Vibrio mangrovi]
MSVEQKVTELVTVTNHLTQVVDNKVAEIDQRVTEAKDSFEQQMTEAKDSFEQWRASARAINLDGEPRYNTVIDLTGLSTDYYFPVWWRMPTNNNGVSRLQIVRHYSTDSEKDPFKNHDPHVAALFTEFEGNACPWDGDANFLTIKRIHQRYRPTIRQIQFGMRCIARPIDGSKPLYNNYTNGQNVYHSIHSGCYLRGGMTYNVLKNFVGSLWYSRELGEVSAGSARSDTFEIQWNVKAYQKDDAFLGSDYGSSNLAYSADYDRRYAPKA